MTAFITPRSGVQASSPLPFLFNNLAIMLPIQYLPLAVIGSDLLPKASTARCRVSTYYPVFYRLDDHLSKGSQKE
jgi:hypothetical protein